MATKGKKISEMSVADELQGDELFPFAKNGDNGATNAGTIKEYCNNGMQGTLQDSTDIEVSSGRLFLTENVKNEINGKQTELVDSEDVVINDNKLSLTEHAKMLLFIDMWKEACGSYGGFNEATGFFELNGLTDITYKEALGIYTLSLPYIGRRIEGQGTPTHVLFYTSYNIGRCRTYMPMAVYNGYVNISYNNKCEILQFSVYRPAKTIWYNNDSLREIRGVTDNASGCNFNLPALQEIRPLVYNKGFEIKSSAVLSLASLKYLVDHALNTEAITITVHPDVYAKLTGDETNAAYADLTDEEKEQWTSLVGMAFAKNISFATV